MDAVEWGKLHKRVADLLGKPLRLYVVATGAGAGIQQTIWEVPGCSSFFVGSSFPYAPEETTGFLGFTPDKFASDEAAVELATAAYQRALNLKEPDKEAIGLALTASVASQHAHRGDHRVHIACMTRTRVIGFTARVEKGEGVEQRLKDGSTADTAALATLFAALDPTDTWGQAFTKDVTQLARERFFQRPFFRPDESREHMVPAVSNDAPIFPGPMFPGHFNPPHEGHFGIADALERTGQGRPVFTICSTPPHKEALTVQEMARRAKMLKGQSVVFTRDDPYYIDKARRFPGRSFCIGADALVRMLDTKWGYDPATMLEELVGLAPKFHVFGRNVKDGFVTAAEAVARVPERFRGRFWPMEGRWDISSTDLRCRTQGVASL